MPIGDPPTADNNRFMGIFWMQGESDGGMSEADYTANLTTVVNMFRNTAYVRKATPTVPIVVNTLNYWWATTATSNANIGVYNAQYNAYNTIPFSATSLTPPDESDMRLESTNVGLPLSLQRVHFSTLSHRLMATSQAVAYYVATGNDQMVAPQAVTDFDGGWTAYRGGLYFTWSSPPGHTDEFTIHINGFANTIPFVTGQYTGYSYLYESVNLFTTYTAYVVANNTLTPSQSPPSNVIVTNASSPLFVPGPPTALSAINITTTSFIVKWSGPTSGPVPATSYNMSIEPGGHGYLLPYGGSLAYGAGLTPNTQYTVTITSLYLDRPPGEETTILVTTNAFDDTSWARWASSTIQDSTHTPVDMDGSSVYYWPNIKPLGDATRELVFASVSTGTVSSQALVRIANTIPVVSLRDSSSTTANQQYRCTPTVLQHTNNGSYTVMLLFCMTDTVHPYRFMFSSAQHPTANPPDLITFGGQTLDVGGDYTTLWAPFNDAGSNGRGTMDPSGAFVPAGAIADAPLVQNPFNVVHVVFNGVGLTMTIYINGTQVSTGPAAARTVDFSFILGNFGLASDAQFTPSAYMVELALFDTANNQSQITAEYAYLRGKYPTLELP